MKFLLALVLMVLCGSVFGGEGTVTDYGRYNYNNNQAVIINEVPAVEIETFAPHNRITDEVIVEEINIVFVANRSKNAFQRRIKIVDGVKVQEIIVNKRVVGIVPVFNNYGFAHNLNIVNFNTYGQNILAFSDFDYRVNNQFYDNSGNLIRQFVVNGAVVAQEIVPQRVVVQFINAFRARNFVVLQQVRSGHCQFSAY